MDLKGFACVPRSASLPSIPRLLDTNTPHESATASGLSLGMQLDCVPPVLVVELVVVLPPLPAGQFINLFAQSSGEVKKHPTAPKRIAPVALSPNPHDV